MINVKDPEKVFGSHNDKCERSWRSIQFSTR